MKPNEQTAYQLGWMAYERGDDGALATADDEFCALAQESGNVGALIRATTWDLTMRCIRQCGISYLAEAGGINTSKH